MSDLCNMSTPGYQLTDTTSDSSSDVDDPTETSSFPVSGDPHHVDNQAETSSVSVSEDPRHVYNQDEISSVSVSEDLRLVDNQAESSSLSVSEDPRYVDNQAVTSSVSVSDDTRNNQQLSDVGSTTSSFPNALEPECIINEALQSLSASEPNLASNEESDREDIILSVFWRKGTLGAATFNTDTSEIHLLNDTADLGPDHIILRLLLLQVNPSHIVTTGALPLDVVNIVKEMAAGINQSASPESLPVSNRLHFLPSHEFKYEIGKHRIAFMKLTSVPPNSTDSEKMIYVQSIVDLSSEVLVSALGALLLFLDKSMTRITLQRQQMFVSGIYNLEIRNHVLVSVATYKALQIFPTPYKKSTCGLRDNLNLLKLYDSCLTSAGSKRLRQLMSLPINDLQELKRRHKIIRFLMHLDNAPVVKSISDSLKGIRNVASIITRMRMVRASVSQWKSLYKTIHNAIQIGEICAALGEDIDLLNGIKDCLDEDLYFVIQSIQKIMDFKESANQDKFVVNPNVCPELDKLKEFHRNIAVKMADVARNELLNLPDYIEFCSILYIPEIGYLLSIPFWKDDLTEEDLQIPGLEHKFNSNGSALFKSDSCRDLDEVLGDSQLAIIEREAKIMLQLIQFIEVQLPGLQKLLNFIAELDCLLSLSVVANEYNLVEPELVEEKIIEIKKGKHPFIDQCNNAIVPNDYVSSIENSMIKIITGPSASGKSVYCKQNLLIVYLAHTGSFVPAESAKIGMIDSLHLVTPTAESAALNISCFMKDLKQLSAMALSVTAKAVIALDDFGKGTTEIDGISLLATFITTWIEKLEHCPHLIVTTHLHDLLSVLPPSPLIKCQTMDYLIDQDEVVNLHQLKDGTVGSSLALQTLKTSRFPDSVIKRSHEVLEAIRCQKPIMPNKDLSSGRRGRLEVLHRILQLGRVTEENFPEVVSWLKSCPRD